MALICDEVLEAAREGKTYQEVLAHASELLTEDDVMPGVKNLLELIQLEAVFPDGTRLVTIRNPIR